METQSNVTLSPVSNICIKWCDLGWKFSPYLYRSSFGALHSSLDHLSHFLSATNASISRPSCIHMRADHYQRLSGPELYYWTDCSSKIDDGHKAFKCSVSHRTIRIYTAPQRQYRKILKQIKLSFKSGTLTIGCDKLWHDDRSMGQLQKWPLTKIKIDHWTLMNYNE